MFMWLGPLAGFLKFGTDGYPRAVQRRLRIVNAMALLIAVFSVIYAAVFAYYDAEHYRHLIGRQSPFGRDRPPRAARPPHQ